jgi:hypothetical protein
MPAVNVTHDTRHAIEAAMHFALRHWQKLVFLFVTTAGPLIPQYVSVGVKGGVPLTNFINTRDAGSSSPMFSSKSNRYTVGPAVEVILQRRLSVEFNALYKHIHFSHHFLSLSASGTDLDISGKTTAGRWEFPVMLKYKPSAGLFLSAGGTIAGLTDPSTRENSCARGLFDLDWTCRELQHSNAFALESQSSAGVVIGGGGEIKISHMRIVPEFRYTNWNRENLRGEVYGLGSNRNQAELLVGIMF